MQAENSPRSGHAHGEHSHGGDELATSHLPVRWGERRYLIPETQVREFYNYVAGYGWREDEIALDFLVRVEDYNKPVSGMPILPPGYERFVRRPIEATIISIGRRIRRTVRAADGTRYYDSLTPITLNVGSASGLREGIVLHLIGSDYPETIELVHIGRRTTQGRVVRSWPEDENEFVLVAPGLRLTTSFPIYHSEMLQRRRQQERRSVKQR